MRYLIVILLFISSGASSQCKTYTLSPNGDTLNCVDMNDKKQGPWVNRVESLRGEPGYEEQGYYLDDQKEGRWQLFSLMGDLMAVENYRFGYKDGKNMYFNRWGQPLREERWRAVDPANPYDTVDVTDPNDPSKVIDRVVVKLEGKTVKHGTWTFYDPEFGTILRTEDYVLDKRKNDLEGLEPIDITKNEDGDKKAVAKPKAILDYEKKNAGKKKIKERTGKTGN